ncbi:unnamed protein product [Cercopithifilaria johnstoni]|uniref:Uncharacterized protein n=1 Tax=Cercopithifilaria johnstoni TaxID=2874296 RepID=A0A8J2Q6I5_9BILA|nr:unnamed protein product [Cercopithifilaria johnstoni]
MIAISARRTNFKETAKPNVSPETIISRTVTEQQHHSRQRIINETYPELSLNHEKKHKVKLRCKAPSLPATIEDASEDEELTTVNNCLSSTTRSLEGRSPHVLPPEELFQHSLLENRDFSSHPLLSPKFKHRHLRPLRITKTINSLSQGFNDPIIRNKRMLSLFNERSNSGNFDSLSSDFLNLPPIPETIPMRKISEKDGSNSGDKEENAFEVLTSEHSNYSTST